MVTVFFCIFLLLKVTHQKQIRAWKALTFYWQEEAMMTVSPCSCNRCQHDVDVQCLYILAEAECIWCIFNLLLFIWGNKQTNKKGHCTFLMTDGQSSFIYNVINKQTKNKQPAKKKKNYSILLGKKNQCKLFENIYLRIISILFI